MTENFGNWMSYNGSEPKKNRAKLACIFCHSKKLKCDLQVRKVRGCNSCTRCDTSGRECRPRPSRRIKPHLGGASLNEEDNGRASASFSHDAITSSRLAHAEASQSLSMGSEMQSLDDSRQGVSSPESNHITTTSIASGGEPTLPLPHSGSNSGWTPFTPHVASSQLPIKSSQTANSPTGGAGRSLAGDVDTGFLQVYGPENEFDAEKQELQASLELKPSLSDPRQQELLQSFAETYFEYCYPWCPVLDKSTIPDDFMSSPLLVNAIATAASHIQPPLVPHEGPAAYYKKATTLFYNDNEPDVLKTLKALSLFYWWAPRPPTTAHRHSSWWWTSVIIRHAQQMNFHREPGPNHPLRHRLDLSLRRRIWWTVFARERITALCQSKPCIIDPEDCSISEPTLADFPSDPVYQRKGEIFIHWVRLSTIMGKVAKALSRSSTISMDSVSINLLQELVQWVQSLPEHLQLPIKSARTWSFDRDVHQLHLPYLTTIIILHLKRSSHSLPQPLPPAILAASCIARVLRDILSRGNARFLMAVTCWYSGTAFLPLLQASRVQELSKEANVGLDILVNAVDQLQQMWASANVIRQGFERLRTSYSTIGSSGMKDVETITGPRGVEGGALSEVPTTPRVSSHWDDFSWMELFPFVTPATNQIAEVLLNRNKDGTATPLPSPDCFSIQDTMFSQYQTLLEPWTDYMFDSLETIPQSWLGNE